MSPTASLEMTSNVVESPDEILQIRIHGPEAGPILIFLPGIHGDWTLVTPFRAQISRSLRFVEFTYPRTLEWTLHDYAKHIIDALAAHEITHGWLLGESFGSQVVWAICDLLQCGPQPPPFKIEGIILAGGFAAYPMKRLARRLESMRSRTPGRGSLPLMYIYAILLRVRFRGSLEARQAAAEFLARRTLLDAQAIHHRLRLLIACDPAPVIATVKAPVFYLSGLLDPIVPWFLVRKQLRRVSPSYRETKIIPTADHNVLGTAPVASARQILNWLNV